jgi:DNA-binding transcriptional MerR regulator
MSPLYTVNELAREAGVTPRTVRFYESKGLLNPERVGKTRVHTGRELARMKIILRGKRLGFALDEIKEYLALYDLDTTGDSGLQTLLSKVWARRQGLERQRTDIDEMMEELADIERQACQALDDFRRDK